MQEEEVVSFSDVVRKEVLEVEYCVNTDERAVGVGPDIVSDDVAELINGLTVVCGEVEMEITAEFPPDYVPPSLKRGEGGGY